MSRASSIVGTAWRAGITILCLAALGLSAGLTGCSHRSPNAPVAIWTPPLDTPVNVLLALKYAYETRDADLLGRLFTDDFVFVFAATDSAGNAFRSSPWTRADELMSDIHMCDGGGAEPRADRITLDFTNMLLDFPSSIQGNDPRWHREIRADMNLRITRGESALEVRGPGLFFFVRGDSAAIPQDLYDQGVRPDSTRWWIERWEDETVGSAGPPPGAATRRGAPAESNPTNTMTWGTIKVMYH